MAINMTITRSRLKVRTVSELEEHCSQVFHLFKEEFKVMRVRVLDIVKDYVFPMGWNLEEE